MARFCPLFSSSDGNCVYIGTASGGILIDTGVSAKRIKTALADIGVELSSIGAVFVTHEHIDHVRGLPVLAGGARLSVYSSPGTIEALRGQGFLSRGIEAYPVNGKGVDICGMHVSAFETSHDSVQSVGYIIVTPDDRKIAVATDTGVVTEAMSTALSGCDLVLLESNHDVGMLRNGPYPYPLKRRILSDKGHLSNDLCSEEAGRLLESGTTRFVLGHLSRENNMPGLALETTRCVFTAMGAAEGIDYTLSVAMPAGVPATVF